MSPEEKQNWINVKEHFESLPEEQRDNHFYRRAQAIAGGSADPMKDALFQPKEDS